MHDSYTGSGDGSTGPIDNGWGYDYDYHLFEAPNGVPNQPLKDFITAVKSLVANHATNDGNAWTFEGVTGIERENQPRTEMSDPIDYNEVHLNEYEVVHYRNDFKFASYLNSNPDTPSYGDQLSFMVGYDCKTVFDLFPTGHANIVQVADAMRNWGAIWEPVSGRCEVAEKSDGSRGWYDPINGQGYLYRLNNVGTVYGK